MLTPEMTHSAPSTEAHTTDTVRDKRMIGFFGLQIDIGKIFSNYFLHHVGDEEGENAPSFVLLSLLVFKLQFSSPVEL